MNLIKLTAAALCLLSVSGCGGFMATAVPISDNSRYVTPRASLEPAAAGQPGLGAAGGGGGGAGVRR